MLEEERREWHKIAGDMYAIASNSPKMPFQTWFTYFCCGRWEACDTLADYLTSFYTVSRSDEKWHCSCSVGQKQYVCKHVLYIRSEVDGYILPEQLNVKKTGRPKKVKKALSKE